MATLLETRGNEDQVLAAESRAVAATAINDVAVEREETTRFLVTFPASKGLLKMATLLDAKGMHEDKVPV